MTSDTPDADRRNLLNAALPAAALAVVAAGSAHAQTPSAVAAPDPGYMIPGLRLAFTAWVQVAPLRTIGEIPGGQGRIAPITGGDFEGPRIRGRIMPGGADWQTVRPDGVTELRAHYGLEAANGQIIQIWNSALVRTDPAPQGDTGPVRFIRSTIRLEAPKGAHDWLNRSVFVGTLNAPADPRAPVTIRCFELI